MKPPRATSLRPGDRSRRRMRRQLVAERLESRHLPSVTLPGITATDPVDGSVALRAPETFAITFDQSVVEEVEAALGGWFGVDPDQVLPTVLASDLGREVEIDQVDAQGDATPDPALAADPPSESFVTSTDATGATVTQLVVQMPPGLPALQPGTYQLGILPDTLLALGFGIVTDPSWYSSNDPIPIAQFTVEGQGATIAGASDLGAVAAQPQTVWSTLDPAEVSSAVAMYRFTLPQGGRWQLDAQVLSAAIDSPLTPAISLIGPDGTVLATRDSGTGPVDDPVDPDLMLDLPGGTYYLGVSAGGDLPGAPGGYDPITGRPGTIGTGEPGGLYELEVSATPAAPPTTLTGFDLEHADALEPSPTGMDLTFSGPVDVTPLARPDQLETELQVVDASGRDWPISAISYQSSQHALTFVFDEPLPAGTYSLVEPAVGGLTDLAGNPIVAPDGSSSGVLATWTVAAPTGPAAPSDLGVIWPGALNTTWNSSIARSDTLSGGEQVDDRFVVICGGVYELQTHVGTGSIDASIEADGGSTLLESDALTGLTHSYVYLTPGVYSLQMGADGPAGATVAWVLKAVALDYEKIAANGVGQSPTLSMALVGPEASTAAASAGLSASITSTGPAATSVAATTATAASAGGGSSGFTAASALLVNPEASLAGMPSPADWNAAAAGSLPDGTAVALADAGRGLPAGLRLSTMGTDRPGAGDPPSGDEPIAAGPLAVGGPDQGPTAGAVGPEAASDRADAMAVALAQADPLVQIAGWFAGSLPATTPTTGDAEIPAADLGSTLLAAAGGPADADGATADSRTDTLVQADLGIPFALLVGTALTYRFSRPIRKWWRRHQAPHPTWPRPYGLARAGRNPARV